MSSRRGRCHMPVLPSQAVLLRKNMARNERMMARRDGELQRGHAPAAPLMRRQDTAARRQNSMGRQQPRVRRITTYRHAANLATPAAYRRSCVPPA